MLRRMYIHWPITNEENQLKGLITVNDIAKSYMEEYDSAIVSVARTPYRNILETLDAEMVVGDEDAYFDKGKVVIAAANPDVMRINIEEHDMVILAIVMSRSCARSRCRRAVLWYALAHRCPGRFSVWRGTAAVRLL